MLESLDFPEPVIHVAVEPKTKNDQDKLSKALQALSEEDPTFQVHSDEETGQTIIGGMGELHLEVLVDRMLREFKVDANVGKPQVAYRETIKSSVEKVETRYVRQTGGRGQYGHVVLEPGADRPRRRLRVRRQDHRRDHPEGVHPLGRRRHPGRHAVRRAGRLPGRRHPGHAGLRVLPRRRLVRDGVQDRRLDLLQGGLPAGPPGPPRADHGGRGGHPRGLHGRRHRQPLVPAGQGRGHGAARQLARRPHPGAARRDVRVRYRPAVAHPGTGDLQHAVPLVPGSSGLHRPGDHQADSGRVHPPAWRCIQ